MNKTPVIIPVLFGTAEVAALNLPATEHNLFGRLIRNPHPAGRYPKEAECTEMLCAVLLNTEILRDTIFGWLARLAGQSIVLESLEFRIETEQSVAGKRDDLRIEGYDPVTGDQLLLWTIEVKVSSGFHYSAALDSENSADLAHQIANYDHWLARQPVDLCAGFVLARRDVAADMPDTLLMPWICLSWTMLGSVIEPLLAGNALSGKETFLARHLLGFIRDHLWEATMDDIDLRLDLDDLALLRAYRAVGNRTVSRVNKIVEPLLEVMANAELGGGKPAISSNVFQGHNRRVVYQSLVDSRNTKPPHLFAGLTTFNGPSVSVWIESSPKYALKPTLHRMLDGRLSMLQQRNPDWKLIALDESSWWDLSLAVPAEHLLVAKNQVAWMSSFVSDAINDLKLAGIIEDARRIALESE